MRKTNQTISTTSPKHNLTSEEENSVYHELLEKLSSARLIHGSMKQLAEKFEISEKTISRIWHRGKATLFYLTDMEDL